MTIQTIEIYKLDIPFVRPLKIAIGNNTAASNIIVRILTEDGLVGWGEASPCPAITGDSQESAYVAAQSFARLIKGRDPLAIQARMGEICASTIGETSAKSAFDMALWDIAAKAAGLPLYRYLGGERRELRTDLTIGLQDTVDETVVQARDILSMGFETIKMKVGRPGLEDVAHVRAVRGCAEPAVKIRIDSNQGWDYPTAVANLSAMATYDIEYSEQPLAAWDYDNCARLRGRVLMPICADESVFDDRDALKLIKAGAVDYLNIKLGKSGGIRTALRINAVAEANGNKCMLGCFGESRLALSANAHLAMARPNIAFVDLDSSYLFKDDPVRNGLSYDESVGGLIHLDDSPGHGAAIREEYLDPASRIVISHSE